MDQSDWERLLGAVREIQEWFPGGVAFIGGVAVHAHLADHDEMTQFAAMSHDADLMILRPDFADLRDIEVVTPNRRGGKQQFSKDEFEFDVYVEGQHNLPVPAEDVVALSEIHQGLRVACPEHLLILKMKAFENRKGTQKGNKDEDDTIRLLLTTENWRPEPLQRLDDAMLDDLGKIVAGDGPTRLAKGNLHKAKALRIKAEDSLGAIEQAFDINYGEDNDDAPTP